MKRRSRLFWRVFGSGLLLLGLTAAAFAVAGALFQREFRDRRPFERLGMHLSQEVSPLLSDPAALQAYLTRTHTLFEDDLWVYRADGTLLAGTHTPAPPFPARPPDDPRADGEPFRPGAARDEDGGEPQPFPPFEPAALRESSEPRPGPWRGPGPHGGRHGHHNQGLEGLSSLIGLESHPIDRRSAWVPLRGADGERATLVIQFTEPVLPAPQGRAALGILLVIGAVSLVSWLLARAITAPVEQLTGVARALGAGDLQARARLARPDELGELSRAFDEMADRLSRMVLSEKELLANVSHELRTPLARMRVALELLEEKHPESAQGYLADMGGSLDELEQLVTDLLTAARLDLAAAMPGKVATPVTLQPIAGAELVQQAAERFQKAGPGRKLTVELDPALPDVEVDLPLMRRLLDNLLENARKYSDPDAAITLRGRAQPGGLVIEVVDRGIGIEPADLHRLFTPFFRTDRSRARGTGGGVGLGLHIAQRIAEAHQATIEAESVVGQGSTFRVTLHAV
jgi:signal transduction histidine kinase